MQLDQTATADETALRLVKKARFRLDSDEYLFFIRAQGELLAAASSKREVRVYDSTTLNFRAAMTGHTSRITSMEWVHGTAGHLVTASEDGTAAVWNAGTGKCVMRLKTPYGEKLYSAACNGKYLVAGGEGDIYFFDVKSQKQVAVISAMHTEAVTQLHFHPRFPNTQLFSASLDGTVNLYDLNTADPDDSLQTTMCSERPVRRMGFFGPNLTWIYCISDDETLATFNMEDEESNGWVLKDVRDRLSAAEGRKVDYLISGGSSPQGPELLLAAGAFDGTICLSLVAGEEARPLQRLEGHGALVRDLTWHDGRVYSVDEAATICVWGTCALAEAVGADLKAKEARLARQGGFKPY